MNRGDDREGFPTDMASWLAKQRWFGGKARHIREAICRDRLRIGLFGHRRRLQLPGGHQLAARQRRHERPLGLVLQL